MTNATLTEDTGLSGLSADAWIDHLEDLTDDLGFFEPLGPDHQACFVEGGPQLLVTFEDIETIQKTPAAEPRSFALARSEGWSVLSIVSHRESWFRHPAIYQFFDRLTDEGFFDRFDTVLFFGAGGAGYAACAYSVSNPGSHVLAIRPQATLDPQVAGWDTRYVAQRRNSFTNRYGYAPDMMDAAARGFVVFSPMQKADAIHAALFTRPNITPLRVPGVGGRLEIALDGIDIIDDMMRAAMNQTLNTISFGKMRSALKGFAAYQRGLFKRAIDAGHRQMAADFAAGLLARQDDAVLAKGLAQLAGDGITPRTPAQVSAAE